jgi:hypothetical protein
MKKILNILLLLIILANVKAQTFTSPANAEIDHNYRTYVNQVFGALEANRISTALLINYI